MDIPKRRFRVVRVSRSSLESRTKMIEHLAGELGLPSAEAVLVSAVDLLSKAVDLARAHGSEKVKIGVARKYSPVFEKPDKPSS